MTQKCYKKGSHFISSSGGQMSSAILFGSSNNIVNNAKILSICMEGFVNVGKVVIYWLVELTD